MFYVSTLRAQRKVPGWRHHGGIRSAEFNDGEMQVKKSIKKLNTGYKFVKNTGTRQSELVLRTGKLI